MEFALVLPLLAVMTFGIIAFGYTFHIQTTIDNAARDGVRVFALTDGPTAAADARAATRAAAAPTLTLTDAQIAVGPAGCPSGQTARVTVTLNNFEPLGGFFGTITLTGSGSMRCNG
ncbi:TadE family protein [Agrococcus sp. HG114]|uniref:TadE family protein n=1 Tax=Agrococcus sp. HG114 TaxID=2969757 RepID=UPI00215B1C0D|nr:TadE family protein [Agrococcus sp. HG114]MCR8670697.1 pilus assembly protein [Agrococcus sp. HG114]